LRRLRPKLVVPVPAGVLSLILAGSVAPHPAGAHEGPPFPIIVDHHIGPYVASVWTDPDIGTGTFFVILEPPAGGRLPERTTVHVAVQPLSARLDEVVYAAEAQSVRHGARYFTKVQFDRGERWRVRVLVEGSAGGGELRAEVEPTPAGTIGPIGLVVYLVPFLAVGFLWVRRVLKRRVDVGGDLG
jgi:hypothetical protein